MAGAVMVWSSGQVSAAPALATAEDSIQQASSRPKSPTNDCPPQYVCLTLDEARSLAKERAELIYLREIHKANRLPRLGLGISVGPTAVVCSGTSGACLGATFGLTVRF